MVGRGGGSKISYRSESLHAGLSNKNEDSKPKKCKPKLVDKTQQPYRKSRGMSYILFTLILVIESQCELQLIFVFNVNNIH